MNEIQQWFTNGCDYASGVLIYNQHPRSNKNIARLLSKRENALNQEKLKYELQKLSKVSVVNKAIKVSKVKTVNTVAVEKLIKSSVDIAKKKASIFFHQLPPELQPVLLKANVLFKECCLLKVQLNALKPKEESKSLSIQLEISDKRKKNELCWSKIDYWLEHKKIAPEPECEFENMTPAQLLRRDQYLFQSKGKLQKRIDLNKAKLETAVSLDEKNRIIRAIEKQEANLLKQETQQLKIKDIINGRK